MEEAKELLAMKYPGELFEPNEDKVKAKYLILAKKYHPDSCQDDLSEQVFSHICELKKLAEDGLREGVWRSRERLFLQLESNEWIYLSCKSEAAFELGNTYWSDDRLAYLIDEEHRELFDNALWQLTHLSFKDSHMEKEFSGILPRLLFHGTLKNKASILILEKKADEYPLSELLEKAGGRFDSRSVAWMISRLCNISCYLQYQGLSHNGLTLDNLFINPFDHGLFLYGGWWYCVPEGERMKGTVAEVYEVMSLKCRNEKQAECITDQEMIHELAKCLLGNKSLVFKKDEITDVPNPMASWIREGSCGSSFEEFQNWNKTLDLSFGKRQFVEIHVPGVC